MPAFTIIIFINVSSPDADPCPGCVADPDESSLLIGNTDGNAGKTVGSDRCRPDASSVSFSLVSLCPLAFGFISPSLPLSLSLSLFLGHPRKITAPDKTRGTLSKGAYIYETFGKQMDKSNISEAGRRSSLRTRPTSFHRIQTHRCWFQHYRASRLRPR